jgi:hypothetical protein
MARSKNASYIKALLGIILIIVIMSVINKISKNADIENYDKYKAKIDNNKKLNPFAEAQKDSVSTLFAGFWQNESLPQGTAPGICDRIEMKKNGIVWRVKTYKYLTSTNDTAYFMHAMTGYLRPFANRKDITSLYTFDMHIIRQTYIGKDTCYGLADIDTTWEITRNENSLKMGNTEYIPYDTTDLAHFFPEGAIALVDAITINACKKDYLTKEYQELAYQRSTISSPKSKEAQK